MFFRFSCLILLCVSISRLSAQDNSNFAHYFMNPYSINPSFAGTDGRPSLFLTYRKQWINIEGAPSIGNASFHSPIGKRVGLGLNVTNAERGILNTTSAFLSNSVNISLSDLMTLRFGASIGAASNTLDINALDNVPASTLALALDQNMYLIGNAGISLQVKYFNFGASIPNLFTDEFISTEDFTIGEVTPLENLLIFASNRFYLTKKHKHMIEPYLLYRYSDVLPPQVEGSLVVTLNHTVWFGGSYKQDFGISAHGGVKFNKVFGLGYSYNIQNSGANEVNSPSHEIQLNLLFGGRKKDRFVYSFVDSELPKKKSKRQEALEKRREELAQQKKEEEEKARLLAEQKAKEEEERKAQEAAEQKAQQEAQRKAQEQSDREAQLAQEQQAEEERKQREASLAAAALEADRESTENVTQTEPTQPEVKEEVVVEKPKEEKSQENLVGKYTTEDRVVVTRGGHLLEIGPGEYVVVGVFTSYELAEKYSDDLFFRGYQSKFGYISQEGYWYVYVFKSSDIEEARSERDQLRQKQVFSKAWVLSVQ
ncbi:PorP/SprF family type IX secretion system membrane protein [Fulvivirga lutimaris]|uniref:PorP/SprF family type IX secretion system membrane protein n=1 Tax=Fulvivirga lutimaris TaxID=1819566 RepID=UPI0012BD2B3D|nr:PorP/SprF family type IX secretion system membrane protein [Fulvivirga lutimaris]MTI38636.1 type IX secretion system membrane protein PorP/SprF [Fulvivirga lutimaris]